MNELELKNLIKSKESENLEFKLKIDEDVLLGYKRVKNERGKMNRIEEFSMWENLRKNRKKGVVKYA